MGGRGSKITIKRGNSISRDVASELSEPIGDSGQPWEGDTIQLTGRQRLEDMYGEYQYSTPNGRDIYITENISNASVDLVADTINAYKKDIITAFKEKYKTVKSSDIEIINGNILTVYTDNGKDFFEIKLSKGKIVTELSKQSSELKNNYILSPDFNFKYVGSKQ